MGPIQEKASLHEPVRGRLEMFWILRGHSCNGGGVRRTVGGISGRMIKKASPGYLCPSAATAQETEYRTTLHETSHFLSLSAFLSFSLIFHII